MQPNPQRLEDASNIRDAMQQISQEASVAVDLLDAKIEDERLDGSSAPKKYEPCWSLYSSLP